MKYILLIYSEDSAWAADELDQARIESVQLCQGLNREGKYVDAAPLEAVTKTTCVKVREGFRTVSDGPFAETKEQIAGYFLIDVESLEEAIDIAARIPGTRRGTTEIRPIVNLPGLP